MKILYIACEPTLAANALAIASAIRSLRPACENILVDPRSVLWPDYTSSFPSDVFNAQGFHGERVFREEFSDILHYDYPVMAYLFYKRLFDHFKPSIIVVMHEYGYAFYAVQAARMFGISTYHVQHGVYEPDRFSARAIPARKLHSKSPHDFSVLLFRKLRQLAGLLNKTSHFPAELVPFREHLRITSDERYPIYADRIALYSRHYKSLLSEQRADFPENRVDVIGVPQSDSFLNTPLKSREEVYAEFNFPTSEKLAVYIYCPFHKLAGYEILVHPEEALIDAVSAVRHVDPGINIVILPHPNYNLSRQVERLKLLTADFVNIAIRSNAADFFLLCKSAALAIGVKSSIFYTAMLAQIPVVIQAYVLKSIVDYQAIEGGGVLPVFHRNNLSHQFEKALNVSRCRERLQDNQREICEYLLGPFDGKCGERAASAIISLAERNDTISSERRTECV